MSQPSVFAAVEDPIDFYDQIKHLLCYLYELWHIIFIYTKKFNDIRSEISHNVDQYEEILRHDMDPCIETIKKIEGLFHDLENISVYPHLCTNASEMHTLLDFIEMEPIQCLIHNLQEQIKSIQNNIGKISIIQKEIEQMTFFFSSLTFRKDVEKENTLLWILSKQKEWNSQKESLPNAKITEITEYYNDLSDLYNRTTGYFLDICHCNRYIETQVTMVHHYEAEINDCIDVKEIADAKKELQRLSAFFTFFMNGYLALVSEWERREMYKKDLIKLAETYANDLQKKHEAEKAKRNDFMRKHEEYLPAELSERLKEKVIQFRVVKDTEETDHDVRIEE